jgi:hypothetical protein
VKLAAPAVLLVAGAVASADVCKDDRACIDACVAGDPVSCVLAWQHEHSTASKLDGADREDACRVDRKKPGRADLCAVYLWRDGDHDKALELWKADCDNERIGGACHAIAIAAPSDHWRDAIEMACAGSAYELPCRISAKFTTVVEGEVGGVKYELEMPAGNLGDDKTKGLPGQHFFAWASDRPAIVVRLARSGSLTCEHVEGKTTGFEHPERFAWLPTGWGDKACKSLKKR